MLKGPDYRARRPLPWKWIMAVIHAIWGEQQIHELLEASAPRDKLPPETSTNYFRDAASRRLVAK